MSIDKVKTIINKWDPIDLMAFSPPDEYEVEIRMISDRLSEVATVVDLAREIQIIFHKQFRAQFNRSFEECMEIAKKIIEG